jgi:hypothetical protein
MPFENKRLLEFLEEVDKILYQKITLIAVGGTAMTLLKLKQSTIDIDFDLSRNEAKAFREALETLKPGFKIDIFEDGLIFTQQLPADYQKNAISIKKAKFKNIQLSALHPLDIVVTKIGRLNERDKEDIKACIRKFKPTKKQVQKRAGQIQYVGHESVYHANLQYVLKNYFK